MYDKNSKYNTSAIYKVDIDGIKIICTIKVKKKQYTEQLVHIKIYTYKKKFKLEKCTKGC